MDKAQVYKLIEDHYRKNFNTLIKKVRNAVGGHHNAEDTVQEAYTRALKYWQTFVLTGSFEPWFHTILNNCIKVTQKDNILNGLVQEDTETAVLESNDCDADSVVLINEIGDYLAKYPKQQQDIIIMVLVFGMTSKEVAEVTMYQSEAIRQMVNRFKKEIRDK